MFKALTQATSLRLVTRVVTLFAYGGLVTGIAYSVGGFSYDLTLGGGLNSGTALAFGALVGMPLIFAGCGLMVGLLAAGLRWWWRYRRR